ncbi:hypothetical protein ZOD2009_08114 [Haladaptatus paucihalophilus DX253]|uniref:Uncharacterized protein n=1 Tax=Haladaptatus paucihalophilus DX253 TaxID=797209 RepID=E7QS50_HALPU|nr:MULTISPECIES: DUF5793 family protein [Haladaptatus]EFW92819.1 hypothetical protein ZOD2009_08114 [Haladaptatus paucihalophilus DX253]ODR82295.1 hypothetical protein BG842_00840 [Haladaptatus sp. W1]GKZ13585.1 hypothetical protein HAL_14660 [Haladaptatus sp. T7]SHK11753.1 hypothetical protein SAMN05444342_0637 [Haladaptatus paucihalophilus DX253]
MRRDYFTLNVENIDWVEADGTPRKPTVIIDFEGPSATLRERLTGPSDELLDASETDVTFRLQASLDDPTATGVVSVTNRTTGDFILELNEDADDVLRFIRAARAYGDETDESNGRYHVDIAINGDHVVEYDKSTFLVYNSEGNLLRQHSLIPSGVEL